MTTDDPKPKKAPAFAQSSGFREANLTATGDRCHRVRQVNPDAFDALLAKTWKAFYAELCTMPDPEIPRKSKKDQEEPTDEPN